MGAGGPGFDFSDIINTWSAPTLRVLVEVWESGMPVSLDCSRHSSKSKSTYSIDTHPCRKRKDAAPSVETVHANSTLKVGEPPLLRERCAHSFRQFVPVVAPLVVE